MIGKGPAWNRITRTGLFGLYMETALFGIEELAKHARLRILYEGGFK